MISNPSALSITCIHGPVATEPHPIQSSDHSPDDYKNWNERWTDTNAPEIVSQSSTNRITGDEKNV